ncbi:MAG TPA: potassium-transporting ATPase subunit KdpA [Chthoniobacterales bacterium]
MSPRDFVQLALYLLGVIALTPLLGAFMARIFQGKSTLLSPLLRPIERTIYRLGGVDEKREMRWTEYCLALLVFNAIGFAFVFLLQITQGWLPLNPAKLANVPAPLALNTAISFMTNTNWQAYSGESTMSYLTQMLGLTVQNFVSAATGIAVMLALTRGLVTRSGEALGNFWTDLTRSTLYVLLPLSLIFALVLVQQGVVQNFRAYDTATLVAPYQVQVQKLNPSGQPIKDAQGNPETEEQTVAEQIIPQGPAASQIAIKQLGTNGGGFFGVNSAHPFENPTPLTNFLEMLAILLIPAALTYTYGVMVGNRRQGWVLFAAMITLFLAGLAVAWWAEASHPSLEGKETRFGIFNSVLWATATTDASNGSVNAMHDSFSPLGGLVPMVNVMLGEVIFGGVGAGMYGILMFAILTVFIAGLMVGRTPEYLGKKIEAHEIRWAMVAVLLPCALILFGSAVAAVLPSALASLNNKGPHGLSEILYAFASAAGNNGSAFAGLSANTNFYNYALGLVMLLGRFGVIIPALAIAGSLARKKIAPLTAGTFPTDGTTFIALLISVILIVGALTFFPALCLGPLVEHFLMNQGRLF